MILELGIKKDTFSVSILFLAMLMIKPKKLNKDDVVVTVSLSWGGPGECPDRYKAGKLQLEQEFGVKVVEGKHTLKPSKWVYEHPEERAIDLMSAFQDPTIHGVISTIGGEESIRILPYIDFDVIRNNPKVFMGYSDSTITHFICYKAGLTSFYGPSIMAGFGENAGLFPYMIDSVHRTLFSNQLIGEIKPNNEVWTNEFLSWNVVENQSIKRSTKPCEGRRWIQGEGVHEGDLLGGCIDVFPFMIGTSIRPSIEDRKDKILFIETSEERMSTALFERTIRNLGSQGILQVLSGIIMGRSQYDYENNSQIDYDASLLKIVTGELGLSHLPIVTNMDFGHTDPMFVLPIGCKAQLDCDNKKFIIDDNACE